MQAVSGQLSILIIEDNPTDLYLIEEMLRSSRVKIKNILTANRTSAGCDLLRKHDINLVLLDLSLPDTFGIDSFLKIKDVTQKIPVIILTGLTDSETALEALKQGAQDYLVKGEFKADILVKSIQYSIERKSAEEKIIASEEKYRQMFYKNPFPAWIYDLKTLQILEVNDAAIQKYDYERNVFLNLNIKDICPEEDITEAMQSIVYRDLSNKVKGRVWSHKKKNGDIILVEVTFYQIDYFGKRAMQAQINDITKKISLEKELVQQQKIRQRQITDAVLSAQEKERKGIGEELHDNINQILATSRLFLNTALNNKELNIDLLSRSQEYISMAMEEIRKLSKVLITPAFIESGLKQSIEELTGNILAAKRIDITTEIEIPGEANLSEGLKLAIYRIIQEQLNNILKHAGASAITIRVNGDADNVLLFMKDNGKGFDTCLHRKGIGITNINSRAELFNGKVEIDSSPGNGCRLTVVLHARAELPQRAA
jgi:two-component system sensor histidine kinase UhpB